jgi:hypothetical protein
MTALPELSTKAETRKEWLGLSCVDFLEFRFGRDN